MVFGWVLENCRFAHAGGFAALADKVARSLFDSGKTELVSGDMLRVLRMMGYEYPAIRKLEAESGTSFHEMVSERLRTMKAPVVVPKPV